MNIHHKSQWDEQQISAFLQSAKYPIRLSFLNSANEPQICSLWYQFADNAIWSASHKNAWLIKQLKHNHKVSFEVSSNEYPYKGVRGKAEIELLQDSAEDILSQLISRYLGNSNAKLSNWLMSRSDDEYVIKIKPVSINAWDFSHRMDKQPAALNP